MIDSRLNHAMAAVDEARTYLADIADGGGLELPERRFLAAARMTLNSALVALESLKGSGGPDAA